MIGKRVPYERVPGKLVLRLPAIVSTLEDLCWTDAKEKKNFEDSRDIVAGMLFHLFNGVCVREDHYIGSRHAVATVVVEFFPGISFEESPSLEKLLLSVSLSMVAELDIRNLYIDGFFPYTSNSLVSERGDIMFAKVSEGTYDQVLGRPGI